ncbi:phage holin family protein [Isoptericola sp. AK164]|uniref:phage holin family protein n=1 Tax=Isoptericola sp. AK164 TaxID=3024246 RepID=UPI0024186E13|nr:phage holin family protein [Isoptericola sp. AK164]
MVRLLARTAVFLLAAAIGVVLTDVLFDAFGWDTFDIVWGDPLGFVLAVVIFALAQAVLSPFFAQLARRNAPTLVGAVGLITTYVALLVASLASDGLTISGWQGWVIGPIVVWLVTMLATFLLPAFILKQAVEERRDRD